MSHFRPDRVFVSIERDRVALIRLGPTGVAEPVAERSLEITLDAERPGEAISTIAAILGEDAWRNTTRHVVLSDRYARYLVLERPQGAHSISELRLAVAARFEDVFDTLASAWRLETDIRPYARSFVACAIPAQMVEAIDGAFSESGRCASIRPYFVSELGRCARRLPPACWFATATRECVTVAQFANDVCVQIRVLPVESPTAAYVSSTLDRERMLFGQQTELAACYFSGTLAGEDAVSNAKRLDRVALGTRPAAWAATYRVALAEVWP